MTAHNREALKGMRVLVTRAAHQADETAAKLRELGADVTALPLIEIGPPDSWEPFDKAVHALANYDWVIFASVNAVESFFKRMLHLHIAVPPALKFATIGPKTSEALEKHGHQSTYQAPTFIAESLVESFPAESAHRVLWPKTNIGRTLIADELSGRGIAVDIVYCYKTGLPADAAAVASELKELLVNAKIDVITLASSQTAKNMRVLLDMVSLNQSSLATVKILAIGPETARTAQQQLGKCDLQAQEYTLDGMIGSLLSLQAH